jgi:hypothetical protein
LENLQQLFDQSFPTLTLDLRLRVVAHALKAFQHLLVSTRPQFDSESSPSSLGTIRATVYQFIAKISYGTLVQGDGNALDNISNIAYDCCYACVLYDNEENAQLCCKTLGTLIKLRRHVGQTYRSISVDGHVKKIVEAFLKVRPQNAFHMVY